MTTIIAKPMTGFMTFIMPSSFSLGTMLAKTVEKDMPMSMKLTTGVGSARVDGKADAGRGQQHRQHHGQRAARRLGALQELAGRQSR